MVILIDPPMWPAHGTTFAHLVSDTSLAELHAFAARAGIPERAFDRDHYDVSARRHAELVALGAEPVTARELVRRLRGSGLRIPARSRADHVDTALRARWDAVGPAGVGLREDLLARWHEPGRHYHDATHLLDVLTALDELTDAVSPALALAAWFHDAVYDGVAGADEEASAALARDALADAPALAAEVARLVLVTIDHSPEPGDLEGDLLCDADLAVLGREPAGYARYLRAVRADYAHVPDADWRVGRSAVLRRLLALDPLYRTERATARWAARARANLTAELAALTSPASETSTPVRSPGMAFGSRPRVGAAFPGLHGAVDGREEGVGAQVGGEVEAARAQDSGPFG